MCQWRFTGGEHYLESQLGYTCTQDHINYATEAGMGAPTIPPLTRGRWSNKQVSCSISTSWPVRSGSYSSTMYHWWPWEPHPITFWSSKQWHTICSALTCSALTCSAVRNWDMRPKRTERSVSWESRLHCRLLFISSYTG